MERLLAELADAEGPYAAWSSALGDAMREDGRAAHEEAVLEGLLGDLGRTSGS